MFIIYLCVCTRVFIISKGYFISFRQLLYGQFQMQYYIITIFSTIKCSYLDFFFFNNNIIVLFLQCIRARDENNIIQH